MNCRQLAGNWKQVKGLTGENLGKLTDVEVDVSAGNGDIPSGKLQERHGATREQAEKEFKDWEASFK